MTLTPAARTGSTTTPQDPPQDPRPSYLHRGLSLLALLALFQGTAEQLRSQALGNRYLVTTLVLLYGAMLVLAVLTLTVRRQRDLVRVDVLVLLVALVRLAVYVAGSAGHHFKPYGDDEGPLITLAARSFASGGHVYGMHWPGFAAQFQVGTTPLMNGGIADSFGYPPLSVLLAAPFASWMPAWVPVAGLMSLGALVLTAVVMFRLLPAPLRPAATLMCFGFTWVFFYARNGYPIFLTLPFLAVAVHRWTRTGSGGVLGRSGVLGAVCLGFAASAHQLTWFLVPFLLAGILLLRRGELPWRSALLVTARYAALALGTFLLLSLPFAIRDGRAWATGLFSVLTQHASPQGLGPVDISYYLTGGSGDLGMYSAAGAALLVATFVAFLLFPQRLAPALVLLPWLAFYLSTRSTETYFVLLAPIWLTAYATCDHDDFSRAWQWRPRLLLDRRVLRAVPVLLALPAVACLLAAVLAPVPLALRISGLRTGTPAQGSPTIEQIDVSLRNVSASPLTPAFATSNNAWLDFGWTVTSGPRTLAPQQSGSYVLTRQGNPLTLNTKGSTYLRVVSDNPQTLTSTALPVKSLSVKSATP
ncbi:hypothetical protein ABIA33_004600 [Streptacidiphilus sp. MAP12-16]|uniref:hypothetical protein n=1 Tax=Streptacidiphilus sp. MAP12-16 TaxID=3156300 RepID=UPI0035154D81